MCKCENIMYIGGKTSDMCNVQFEDKAHDGYVPDLGFGEGDYFDFDVCIECGKIQNWTPMTVEHVNGMLDNSL